MGCLVTTNHNKAAVRGLVCQPITVYVGHLCWQLSVATLSAASGDPVPKTFNSMSATRCGHW